MLRILQTASSVQLIPFNENGPYSKLSVLQM